jgi:N-acetylneuraminic acid mutarotase
MPTARGGLAAAALDGRLWVTGGEILDESRVTYPQLEVYDPPSDTWQSAPPTPTGRHGLAAVPVDGQLYVVGGGRLAGLDVSGLTEIYDPAA